MTVSENLPDLRLVRVDQVRFHEHPERNRTLRLVERLRADRRLRNPPIVAEIGDDDYVLLDGANRLSAFRELGHAHVPVQVIDYGQPAVQLKGWHHLLVEGRGLGLRAAYAALPGVRLEPVERGRITGLLELRAVYAVLVEDTDRCWALWPAGEPNVRLVPWMRALDGVVAAYEGRTRLERIKLADYDRLPQVFETVEHQLVLFPTLTKIELLQLVRDGVMIPTGITRHLIPGRALGLNLDLGFLEDLGGEAERQRHFADFVRRIEVEGRIRFYEESLFIMNE